MVEYQQPRCDPSVVKVLIDLRELAGLNQTEASSAVGLDGVKSRDSLGKWESGMSKPRSTRRPDFINYLIDALFLRRDPALFDQVWNDVMVGQWAWPSVSDTEWARLFPGQNRSGKVSIAEPPRLIPPPNVDTFIGRVSEIDNLLAKLERSHRIVLTGIPGAGKTWLAAYLAIRFRDPDLIFWHSFRLGEDAAALIWRLAGFLYWRGHKDLWLMLQTGRQSGGYMPPMDVIVDYLGEWLSKGGYLLCLDDFQFVDEDSLVDTLLDRLAPSQERGTLSLLLTSRRILPLRADLECWPVRGFSQQDSSDLLKGRGVILPEAMLVNLNDATEGNPGVLCLAANELLSGTDPQSLILTLTQTDSISRFLVSQVDKRLSDAERTVMVVLALTGPCTRKVVEAVSDAPGISQTLRELQDGYLLHFVVGDTDREYDLHSLLRPFYFDAPSAQQRISLHTRAGEHYEREQDNLLAASHFLQAEQQERAALLATPNVWTATNRGQLHIARQVLVGLSANGAVTSRWPTVWIAMGQVYALLRETSAARQALERAYTLQTALPDSIHVREKLAIICHLMGELLKFDAPREALEWLDRGLVAISSVFDPSAETTEMVFRPQAAALHIESGSVYSKLGQFSDALSELEQGLALLSEEPTVTRAAGLINLGIVHCIQGNTDRGVECYKQSIVISQKLGDLWRVLSARHNLGIEMDIAGVWEAASREYAAALDLADRLASRKHRVQVALSSGILETKRGNYEEAEELLVSSLEMAQQLVLQDHVVAAQSSLAQLMLRQGATDIANDLLAAAEAIATELEAQDQLPEIWRGQAEVALAWGRTDEGLETIKQSIDLARKLDLNLELGMSLRVLAQILGASGSDATGAFEESLSLLRSRDPYEAARTEEQWALDRLRRGDVVGADKLLNSAHGVFLRLGARHDMAEIEPIIGKVL